MFRDGLRSFDAEVAKEKMVKTKTEELLPELVSGSEEQIEDRLSVWREILAKDYEKKIKIDGQIGPEINFVLKDKDNNEVSITERFNYSDTGGYQLDVFSGGKKIGFLRYQAGPGSTPINMGKTDINEKFRRLGINTLLFQHMTKLHPGAESVWSKLDDDNWVVYDSAIKSGKTPEEAINETPAGKVRLKSGWILDIEESVLPFIDEGYHNVSRTIRPVYIKKNNNNV